MPPDNAPLSLIKPIPAKFAPISPTLEVEAIEDRGLAERRAFFNEPGADRAWSDSPSVSPTRCPTGVGGGILLATGFVELSGASLLKCPYRARTGDTDVEPVVPLELGRCWAKLEGPASLDPMPY